MQGIININPESITDLYITENSSLSYCEIQTVCDFIDNPNGNIVIYDNSSGCNSQEEVEEACETVSIYEVLLAGNITSSPNPFSTSTTLSYELKQPETVQLSVFNQLGQIVYLHSEEQAQCKQQMQWDAQDQPEGLYYYQLQVGEHIATGKLVKVR